MSHYYFPINPTQFFLARQLLVHTITPRGNNFFDLLFNRLLLQNQYAEFYRRHDDLFTNWVPQYFIVFIVQWQVAMLCVDKMCL